MHFFMFVNLFCLFITFLCEFLWNFFNGFEITMKVGFFRYPNWIFSRNLVLPLFALLVILKPNAVAGGGLLFRVCCHSWRNDGYGGSGVDRNWPGKTGCAPNTASAGEKAVSSLQADRIPSMTQGRWASHSAPAARARRASFSLLWKRYTAPFAWGW